MSDVKYFLAYSIPLSAIVGMEIGGVWSFTTVLYAFGFIPICEAFLKPNPEKLNEEKIQNRLTNRFFDLMLYFNIFIVFSILIMGIGQLTSQSLLVHERIGLVLSVGIVLGTNGLNVAHELGHRTTFWERTLAKFLLMPALYMHFYIEHNFGHHQNVGTPKDPATSKKINRFSHFGLAQLLVKCAMRFSFKKTSLKIKNGVFLACTMISFFISCFSCFI